MPQPATGRCSVCKRPATFLLEVTHKPLCTACYGRILTRRVHDTVKHCSEKSTIISIDIPLEPVKSLLKLQGNTTCSIILATADSLARLLIAYYLQTNDPCSREAQRILTLPHTVYPFAKTSRDEVRTILTLPLTPLSCDPTIETLLSRLLTHDAEATLRSLAKSFQRIRPGERVKDSAAEALNILRKREEKA